MARTPVNLRKQAKAAKGKPGKPDKTGDDPIVKSWRERIGAYHADFEKWQKRCEKIVKRYRDERKTGEGAGSTDDKTRRYNILWSNVQTLRPALYGQQPTTIVERRFLDRDPVARAAASIWERAIKYQIEDSHYHRTMKKTVLDYLLVARGVPWVRYEPVFEPALSPSPSGEDDGDKFGQEGQGEIDSPAPQEEVKTERCCIDYVHWRDFFHAQARIWEENDFVGRRIYLDELEMEARFGKAVADEVTYSHMPDRLHDGGRATSTDKAVRKAEVFEIWNKADRKVYFIATGYEHLLEDPKQDPLKLEGFWPCPEPLYGTLTNDTLVPVPEYIQYQDQAQELDELTNRIASLQKALKVAGVYDASAKGLQRLLTEGVDNELIPVSTWAMFAEKGGLKGAVDFLPIDMVAEVLKGLYECRDKIKQDLYEITGISDVIRGSSDPRETAAAQKLKSNFGSLRLQERQGEVARFARDTIRIMGEIIAEHFTDETLIEISGALYDDALMMPNPILAQLQPQAQTQPQPGAPPGGAPMPPGMPPGIPIKPPNAPPPGPLPPTGPPGIPPAPPHPPGAPPQGMGQPSPPGLPPMQGQPIQLPPMNPETGQPYTPAQIDALPKMVPDMGLINKAIQLLRNDKLRGFRIDIETDSTVQPNADQDKADRTAFIESITKFMQASTMLGAQMPDAVPMLGKLLQFGVRGFRVGRDLESTIDEFVDKAEKQAKARQANPQPSPEQLKMQMEQQKSQAEIQKAQTDAQNEADNRKAELQMKQMDVQMRQMEMDMKRMELQHKQMESSMNAFSQPQGVDPMGNPITPDHPLHPMQQIGKLHDSAQLISHAVKQMTAPKRLVKGPDGKAIGVVHEPIGPPPAPTPMPKPMTADHPSHPFHQIHAMSTAAQAIAAHAQRNAAPKRIRRDARGKAAGIEPVA